MKRHSIEIIAHQELIEADLHGLRQLFDSEYQEFGEWDPQQPYGYAPHDVHIMARNEGRVVGHVGWARRENTVGTEKLTWKPFMALMGRGRVPVQRLALKPRLR